MLNASETWHIVSHDEYATSAATYAEHGGAHLIQTPALRNINFQPKIALTGN